MADEVATNGRVIFGRGYNVWIMAIDGTWRRSCVLKAVSSYDAELILETSIEGLNLKEFFLLLSSTGLAYRRCELVKVNGAQIDIRFLNAKGTKKKSPAKNDQGDMADA
ncbi:MAG: PilZ domain-containing protein [Pseudomonadota bacterium]